MTVRNAKTISGNIFWEGEFRNGTIIADGGRLVFEEGESAEHNTILPAPVNAHTHIGDSFITREPTGTLASIVGPGGFKENELGRASSGTIAAGMRRTIDYLKRICSPVIIDFRESGASGVMAMRSALTDSVMPIILSRGSSSEELISSIRISDGIGISSEKDLDHSLINQASKIAKDNGKIFAIHVSEVERENMDYVISLQPDFVVHGINASIEDLESLADRKIPLAITPRSNYFYGMRPDYSLMTDSGIEMMLGTDNAMITAPDIYAEMDFLYRIQKSVNRISPDDIINMVFMNPYKRLERYLSEQSRLFLQFPHVRISSYEIVTRASQFEKKLVRISDVTHS
ncbi:MAG: amidohydrolase family protein [Thermoplasmataceae archaeon]